jgi:hypothetical protein
MDNLEEFLEWYWLLNPEEEVDLHEAYTIFFYQDIYLEAT